nr:MAG TPA: hypothetical protein [Caudoviricetes sp.]
MEIMFSDLKSKTQPQKTRWRGHFVPSFLL